MKTQDLVSNLNALLEIDSVVDYAPNGLQIEGRAEIHKVLTAVSASLAAVEEAVRVGADALLVHHGYFWKSESPQIVGIKRQRIAALLSNNINLLAYHLPLDLHPLLGNNALIGKDFAASFALENISQDPREKLLNFGEIAASKPALSATELALHLERIFARKAQFVGNLGRKIRKIAWCSGAGQDFILRAAALGADAFISGEHSERSFHEACESGIIYYSCGHHATERGGVRALSTYLCEQYCLESDFYEQENPF